MNFLCCPRCGENGYEILQTYSHCVACNYSPTLDEPYTRDIPEWALQAIEVEFNESMK